MQPALSYFACRSESNKNSTLQIRKDGKTNRNIRENGHAEVLGLVGQTNGQAIIIENLEEAEKLDFSKDIRLYSQTTKSLDEFRQIVAYIQEHISPNATFSITIQYAVR